MRKLLVVHLLLEAEERPGQARAADRADVTAPVAYAFYLVTGPRVRAVSRSAPPAGPARSSPVGGRARDLASACNQAAVHARRHRGGQGSDGEAFGPPSGCQGVVGGTEHASKPE
jgi:hypothetical protein